MTLLEPLVGTFNRLRKLWVDGGFSGETFADWVKEGRETGVMVSDITNVFPVQVRTKEVQMNFQTHKRGRRMRRVASTNANPNLPYGF